MKSKKLNLAIKFDLVEEATLQYFFRPFAWNRIDYNFCFSESKQSSYLEVSPSLPTKNNISEPNKISQNITHQEVLTVVENVAKHAKKDTDTPVDDILESYKNIAQRYN